MFAIKINVLSRRIAPLTIDQYLYCRVYLICKRVTRTDSAARFIQQFPPRRAMHRFFNSSEVLREVLLINLQLGFGRRSARTQGLRPGRNQNATAGFRAQYRDTRVKG